MQIEEVNDGPVSESVEEVSGRAADDQVKTNMEEVATDRNRDEVIDNDSQSDQRDEIEESVFSFAVATGKKAEGGAVVLHMGEVKNTWDQDDMAIERKVALDDGLRRLVGAKHEEGEKEEEKPPKEWARPGAIGNRHL